MLPCSATLTSCSVGRGFCSSSAVALISIPGVQYPHWRPWWSRNDCCNGVSSPSPLARPSTVVIDAPSAWTASMQQLLIASLPSCTVQAPQLPVSQPMCGPVRSTSSRRKWTRRSDAGTSRSYVVPLISTEILRLVDVVDTLTPLLSLPPGGLPGPPTPRRG